MSENGLTGHEKVPKEPTEQEKLAAVVDEKLSDMDTPGFEVEFDPEEAEYAGAFLEDALSEEDAKESATDLAEAEVKS